MSDEEIPLDISGHDDRERPGKADSGLLGGDDDSENAPADDDEQVTDGDDLVDDSDDPADGEDEEVDLVDGEDEEVEPVEVLVQLAKKDEINPWDIDIVKVTDKFLDALDEADLRTSGRALFYASVLLRLKSDAMLEDDEPEPEPEPWEQAMVDGESFDDPDPFATLEHEIDRRIERKRARGTPQTLDELVRELREAERGNWYKESREYDTSDSPQSHSKGTQELDYRSADQFRMDDEPTEADVTGTTHTEDIDVVIEDVHTAVRKQYDQGRKEVLFREVEAAGGSRVQTYLGLLFLSHRGHVRLRQDDLFGDLWIQDPNAVSGSGEVAAD